MSNYDNDATDDRNRIAEADDGIQHGIDDDPHNDAEKGATLGGVGGAVTGALAGAVAGPIGAVAGAIIGGVVGAIASGAAVGAVDRVDNDDTISGLGEGVTPDVDSDDESVYDAGGTTTGSYRSAGATTGGTYDRTVDMPGNGVPGIQTGGRTVGGGADTRGIMEKAADAVTGDTIDDKTGRRVAGATGGGIMDRAANAIDNAADTVKSGAREAWDNTKEAWDDAKSAADDTVVDATRAAKGAGRGIAQSASTAAQGMASVGNRMPGIQTGGVANDGTADTRGILEKAADAVTGDTIDDKTGKVVDHP